VYHRKDILFNTDLDVPVPRIPVHRSGNGKMTGTVTEPLAMYTSVYALCDIAVRLEGVPMELAAPTPFRHWRQPGWIGKNLVRYHVLHAILAFLNLTIQQYLERLEDLKSVLESFIREVKVMDTLLRDGPGLLVGEDPCFALANHVAETKKQQKALTIVKNITVLGFCISAMKKVCASAK
jgi:hypothetical protein